MKKSIKSLVNLTPESLVNKFLECEDKLGLLDKKGSDNYLWEWAAHRIDIYYSIALEKKILGEPHIETSWILRLKRIFSTLFYLLKSPLFSLKKHEIVVIPHRRKSIKDGIAVDLNSKYVREDLEKTSDVAIWDLPYDNQHKFYGSNVYYLDVITFIAKIWSFLGPFVISNKVRATCEKVEKYLDLKIDLTRKVSKLSFQFRMKKILFKLMLKVRCVKKLYMVTAYGQTSFIKAAKELGIETVELQHGVINEFHLGYHFPDASVVEYFPDQLWVWHAMWKKNAIFPIEDDKVVINTNNHLEDLKPSCSTATEPNSILVISQGTIGNELADFIHSKYEAIKDYKIYYKLHPGEFENWNSYTSLRKLVADDKVVLVKGEQSVYELFSKVSKVVGVYSTALYEASYFGKRVFITPISGSEYMDNLLAQENAAFFDHIEN